MKLILTTNRGIEYAVVKEVWELCSEKADIIGPGVLRAELSPKNAALYVYRCQAVETVSVLLGKSDVKEKDFFGAIEACAKDVDWANALKNVSSVAFSSVKDADSGITTPEIADILSTVIKEKSPGVNLVYKEEDASIVVVLTNDSVFVCRRLHKHDLSRREYRVFLDRDSLRGAVAYAAFRLTEIKKGLFLDPFCRSGSIVIEAAMYAQGLAPHRYHREWLDLRPLGFSDDEKEKVLDGAEKTTPKDIVVMARDPLFRSVELTRKNGVVAGVVKSLDLARVDTEWLDFKVKEKVDAIATMPPQLQHGITPESLKKKYGLLAERLADITRKGAIAVFVMKRKRDFLIDAFTSFKDKNLKDAWAHKETLNIFQGQEPIDMVLMERV